MISVVVPVYKTAQFVAETLDSILMQTYRDYEIIVVNDGDPDSVELERVLEPYRERIVYVRHAENRGLSAARNTGIGIARYDLIALLDSDDIWLPNYLETQIGYLRDHPEVDLVYGDAEIFGPRAVAGRFSDDSPSQGPVTFESLVRQQCTVLVSVLGKKQAFLDAGLFDPAVRSSEDFDVWLRMLKAGYRIGYHKQIVMRYRARLDSLSSDDGRMARSAAQVLRKIEENLTLDASEASAVREQLQVFDARASLSSAKQALQTGDYQLAACQLRNANAVLGSFRLSVVSLLLHTIPDLLSWIYRRRTERSFVV